MKKSVLIPISGHFSGLHDGHRALISLGKEISNEVEVSVTKPNRDRWYDYLRTGERRDLDQEIGATISDLDALNIPVKLREAPVYPEAYREEKYRQAQGLASYFDLLLDYYNKTAPMVLMSSLLIPSGMTSKNTEAIIRGPEIMNFMLEAARKLTGFHIPTVFYPNIIKDPLLGIKKSTFTGTVHHSYVKDVKRLNQVIIGAKPYYKVGDNKDLVKELNNSYKSRIWEIRGIAVFEGGFVPGRLEITQFVFPTEKGWKEPVTIEEVEYQC